MCTEKVKSRTNTILWAVLMVSVLLNGFLIGRLYRLDKVDVLDVDTVYVYDTIRIIEPTPTEEDVVRHDTASFPMVGQSEPKDELKNIPICNELDSIGRLSNGLSNGLSNDSAKVVIPITERTYEDSTYKAVVRGYNPELVSLDIYGQQTTVYRQQTGKPKVVVGIGPYAGFGNKGFNYGIAVNVSMPIWSW